MGEREEGDEPPLPLSADERTPLSFSTKELACELIKRCGGKDAAMKLLAEITGDEGGTLEKHAVANSPCLDAVSKAVDELHNGDFERAGLLMEKEQEAHDHDSMGVLSRKVEDLAQDLERRFEESRQLIILTEQINTGLDVGDIMDFVYEHFRPLIPYDRIGCALVGKNTPEGPLLVSRYARSESPHVLVRLGYRTVLHEGSSLRRLLRTGEMRVINDLPAYMAAHPKSTSTRLIVLEGGRSSLTCPLIANGKPIGVLFFTSFNPGTYTHIHTRTIRAIAGSLAITVEKSRLYQRVLKEKEVNEHLLLNILPRPIAKRLSRREEPIADKLESCSCLFADFVGFTSLSASMSPAELVSLLDDVFTEFDELSVRLGVFKVKTIGDCYMAATGVPEYRADHAAALVQFGLAVVEAAASFAGRGIAVRVGINSGAVVAGVIGKSKFAYDLWGDTVNMASRMESTGVPGRVQVSAETAELVRGTFALEERGLVEVKGKGLCQTFLVMPPRPPGILASIRAAAPVSAAPAKVAVAGGTGVGVAPAAAGTSRAGRGHRWLAAAAAATALGGASSNGGSDDGGSSGMAPGLAPAEPAALGPKGESLLEKLDRILADENDEGGETLASPETDANGGPPPEVARSFVTRTAPALGGHGHGPHYTFDTPTHGPFSKKSSGILVGGGVALGVGIIMFAVTLQQHKSGFAGKK